ncbi:hypothetical protein HDV00_010671 [Rhizophlyctis rosea]|nr:hypothetical protein HDV00_010671 [Rhizophlyctis rosea]
MIGSQATTPQNILRELEKQTYKVQGLKYEMTAILARIDRFQSSPNSVERQQVPTLQNILAETQTEKFRAERKLTSILRQLQDHGDPAIRASPVITAAKGELGA